MARSDMCWRSAAVGSAAALAWGAITAMTDMDFGAVAWLAGAAIGVCSRSACGGRPRGGMPAMLIAALTFLAAKLVFVFWPIGPAKPTLLGAFRWIDLLWLAMAVSAAQWMATWRSVPRQTQEVAAVPSGRRLPLARRAPGTLRAASERAPALPRWAGEAPSRARSDTKRET